jgi:hypothetical protein
MCTYVCMYEYVYIKKPEDLGISKYSRVFWVFKAVKNWEKYSTRYINIYIFHVYLCVYIYINL